MVDKIKENAVYIIDGSSFLYRAFYAIRQLTTKSGIPVNAVFGFCRMIKKLVDTHDPKSMILVWDSRGKTIRHDLYDQYKATRQSTPSDLMEQKELIKEFANIIGLEQIEIEQTEADDIIFSIAKVLETKNVNSIIVSSDKDLRQILSDKVIVWDPFKAEFITQESYETKIGFPISKLPFYFALIGDSSDNIPGVKGVGPKTAEDIVKQFDSLEHLYANIALVKSDRIKNLLLENKSEAFLSLELFKLRYVEVLITENSCNFDKNGWSNARDFFEKLEFKSLAAEIPGESVKPIAVKNLSEIYSFRTVRTPEALNEVCNQIKKFKRCAIDTEGVGTRPLEGLMVGISVCVEEGISYYIPFRHATEELQLSSEKVLSELKPLFEDPTIEKYLHHAKFDKLMLQTDGINLQGITFDTIIAASLLVADGQRVGLKYLSDFYFNEPMVHFADLVNKKAYKDFAHVPVDIAGQYAAADAHQTMKLYNQFKSAISKENMDKLYFDLEMPTMEVLCKVEAAGIKCDPTIFIEIDNIVTREISQLRTAIIDLIGHQFANINLNSPRQLEDLLFNHLQLPAVKKTAQKTAYSTDQEVLQELSKIHPVPALIIKYRELFKLKSTYLETLGTFINPKTGRIHTTFSQTQVVTGRLASSEPNLQNIPVDRYGIRSAFKAEQNHVFLSADYSQIELRVLGYLSQDPVLIKAFNESRDIHAMTASGLFGVPVDQVTSEQRQLGKTINFSILYGLTPHGLSKDLDISYSLAKDYIDKFMAQYPRVAAWMEEVVHFAKEHGYVQTLFGRRRYLPGIHEKNKSLFDLARRTGINTVAQGTAAELVKLGMINLSKAFEDQNLKNRIILQIHDELLIEVPKDQVQVTEQLVKSILESVVSWNIPLTVTTRIGDNWQEVTK